MPVAVPTSQPLRNSRPTPTAQGPATTRSSSACCGRCCPKPSAIARPRPPRTRRYWKRLDPAPERHALNFLLFGYGETHEPPLTERAFIGSLTIFSYDYATRQIDLVSLTHDIRAPEAERYLHAPGPGRQVGPIKIDQAYSMGGFDLMRRTLEDATGLAIDFQLAFNESAIAGATDNVFGGLDVDVPLAFKVNAFYLDGEKYPAGEFQPGAPAAERHAGHPVHQDRAGRGALRPGARAQRAQAPGVPFAHGRAASEHSSDVAFLGRGGAVLQRPGGPGLDCLRLRPAGPARRQPARR